MKIGFVTCVQLGLSCIERIYEIGGHLDVLITLKDNKSVNKSGRIYLDEIATENKVPLEKINHINDEESLKMLGKYNLDWLFIIGWSQIASKEVLSSAKMGCIGIHPTLLPIGRGRAAIPWAIIKGLDKTGVTMFKLDEGVDTGEVLGQIEISLNDEITSTELYKQVDQAHVSLIEKVFPSLIKNTQVLLKQDESKATYWEGRKPVDGELFSTMNMIEANRLVRATTKPYPGAFYMNGEKKVIVWSANFNSEAVGDCSFKLSDGYLNPIEFEIQ